MEAKIVVCDCKHEFQDKTYGKNKRLANPSEKANGTYTCTVCGKKHKIKQ